jgi:hypothetical protein
MVANARCCVRDAILQLSPLLVVENIPYGVRRRETQAFVDKKEKGDSRFFSEEMRKILQNVRITLHYVLCVLQQYDVDIGHFGSRTISNRNTSALSP